MFGVGGGEIVIIALIALILFGDENLPKNMRKIVKTWNNFRGMTNDLQRSWLDVRDQVTRDLLTDHQSESKAEQNNENQQSIVTENGEFHPLDEDVKPEGLHDGVLGAPIVQQAEGRVAQGELMSEHKEGEVNSSPQSDKST